MNSTCSLGIRGVCEATEASLSQHVREIVTSVSGVAMLAFVGGTGVHHLDVTWMPESLVVVCLGVMLGFILYRSPFGGEADYLDEEVVSLLFNWMLTTWALPLIIFESGWSLRLRDFVSQMGYILLFAIFGTLICVAVISAIILYTCEYHGVCQPRIAFAYASLISSVDPVATLATFASLNVDPLLFILVFGESQINDAVAITLFESLNEEGIQDAGSLLLHMASLLFGSIGAGLLLGSIYLLLIRCTKMGHCPPYVILFICISSIFTYSAAETVGLSGIITVLFESILMGAYTPAHMSTETMSLASFLLKQMSSIADTLIFMACGVVAVFVLQSQHPCTRFAFTAIVACMLSRAVAIVPLALISNCIKRCVSKTLPAEKRHYITPQHMFMMWHSGLRGGVSLVLVMKLGPWVDSDAGRGTKDVLVNSTFVLVVAYLFVFGSTAGFCLRCLGLPLGDEVPEGQTLYEMTDKNGIGWRSVKYWRKHILAPVLVGPRPIQQDDHLMADLVQEAKTTLQRGRTAKFQRRRQLRAMIHNMFGTDDPSHADDAEDIADDMLSSSSSEDGSESGEDVALSAHSNSRG